MSTHNGSSASPEDLALTALKAAAVGAVAGSRSLTAPAILSLEAARGKAARHDPLEGTPFDPLAQPGVATALCALAVGEMIVDKLPVTPARTMLPSVVFRGVSGAVAGSALFSAARRPAALGAILGAASAVAATYALYHLRRSAGEKLHAPDPALGLAEDALAVSAGIGVLRSLAQG